MVQTGLLLLTFLKTVKYSKLTCLTNHKYVRSKRKQNEAFRSKFEHRTQLQKILKFDLVTIWSGVQVEINKNKILGKSLKLLGPE